MTWRFGHGHRWHRGHETDRHGGHHGRDCRKPVDDHRDGRDGADRFWGGRGDDQLHGGAGDDWLHGGRGNDQLFGDTGNDKLFGGTGNDLFVYRAGDGHDYVNGGWGHDVLRLEAQDWVLDLDRGEIVSRDENGIRLSSGAAGTITLADGDTIRFDRVERIESPASEPTPGNQAPAGLALAVGSVDEGAPHGTVVGTVLAVDPDAGDTLTYALTDDADGRFAIDPDTGVITVTDGARLDHETSTEHSIGVRVTDAGGLSATETFVVGVADVNEAPMLSELSGAEVLEGTADGTVVGAVFATDPDAGDTLTYALTDDADGRFAIDPDTGVITVVDGARLDHETSPSHSIGVRVTDAGGLSDTDSFLIAVQLDDTADDIITGGAGDDVLGGGPGRDQMFGLDGNDELDGGDGDDLIEGGNGDDVLIGGNGVDVLDGGNGNDIAFGDNGDDHLIGGLGNDQLYGGLDHDLLEGGSGDDLLQGNAGDDMLSGGAGDDRLLGGMGADTLAGGPGDDMLSGGTEADRFVFTTIDEGLDVIEDFQADDILAIGETLVGYAAGDEAAFVRLVDDGTDTTVQVDPDGAANGTAFSSIVVLDGVTGMTLDDLVNAGQIDFWMS